MTEAIERVYVVTISKRDVETVYHVSATSDREARLELLSELYGNGIARTLSGYCREHGISVNAVLYQPTTARKIYEYNRTTGAMT